MDNNSSSTSQQQQVQEEIIQVKDKIGRYDLKIEAADDDDKLVTAFKKFCKRKIQKVHRDIEDNDEFYEHYENELAEYQAKLEKKIDFNKNEAKELENSKLILLNIGRYIY